MRSATFFLLALVAAAPAQEPRTLTGHDGWVGGVVFLPDGKTLVTASADHTARLWEWDSGKTAAILKGHTDIVAAVAVSPDGRHIATGSYDQTARLWVSGLAFAPDGETLVSA